MKSKFTPPISVVMAVFNGESHLAEAVETILNQTYNDFEFIIVDDCSTDTSQEIIRNYLRSDSRVQLIVNDKNLGLARSLNRGIYSARGDLIARMDADDVSLPERLSFQIKAFQENQSLDLVACGYKYINEVGIVVQNGSGYSNNLYRLWRMQFHNVYIHSSVMFKRNDSVGFYNENVETAQDYDLWSRLVKKDNTQYLETPLIHYRISNNQISNLRQAEQIFSALTSSFHNLQLCYPPIKQVESQCLCRAYMSGHLAPAEFKHLSILFPILNGFLRKYNLPMSVRPQLMRLVIKDILYWLRRINFYV